MGPLNLEIKGPNLLGPWKIVKALKNVTERAQKVLNIFGYFNPCLLLIFIYFNSKFKVTCKNRDFEYLYIRTHSKKKNKKNKQFLIDFCHFAFSHLNAATTLLSWVLWNLQCTSLDETSRYVSRLFILAHTKSRVCQFQVCYLHTIHLGVPNLAKGLCLLDQEWKNNEMGINR